MTQPRLAGLLEGLESVVLGQRRVVELLVIGLICEGHVLLEGMPGLAKTLAARTLARLLDLTYRRVQFTPDLLPADLTGTLIYDPRTGEFPVKHGPVFTQILLADEINRAPAKVQSALLEAMQEHQVTLGEVSHPLPRPFFVVATQNPIEQEGTYALPEAQLDRFLLKVRVEYPARADELRVVHQWGKSEPPRHVAPVLNAVQLEVIREEVEAVHVDARIEGYLVDLVRATRPGPEQAKELAGLVEYAASPRAAIALYRAGKAQAYLSARDFVVPDDIKAVAHEVLRHRLRASFEAEAQGLAADDLIGRLLKAVPTP